MKIIFLDIDGVLCTTRAHIAQNRARTEWHMTALDRESVGLLNDIYNHDRDHTIFVLSSTWRIQYDEEYMTNHLRKFGWVGKFHDDWRTARIPGPRHGEIVDWLNRNGTADPYVIFDDSLDAGVVGKFRDSNFIQTDPDYGISLTNYNDAMHILHGKKSDIYLV